MQVPTDLECVVFTEHPLEKLIQLCTNDVSLVDRRVDVVHVLSFVHLVFRTLLEKGRNFRWCESLFTYITLQP